MTALETFPHRSIATQTERRKRTRAPFQHEAALTKPRSATKPVREANLKITWAGARLQRNAASPGLDFFP